MYACPKCSRPVEHTHLFCPACGAGLAEFWASPADEPIEGAGAFTVQPAGNRKAWAAVAFIVAIAAVSWVYTATRPDQTSITAGEAADRLMASMGSPIEYCWAGTPGAVSITMSTASGGTSQASGKANNQCIEAGYFDPGAFAYVSVQRGGGSGTISCSIKLGGTVVETNSSDGEYVIASCSGRV